MPETASPYRPATLIPAQAATRQGTHAGVVSRTLAMIVDIGVVAAGTAGIYLGWLGLRFLARPRSFDLGQIHLAHVVWIGWLLALVLLTAGWDTKGRTMGGRVMGLRVTRIGGGDLGFWRSFFRAVLCMLFPILLFWCAISRRQASVQDLIVRTEVRYDWRARADDPLPGPSSDAPTS
jgi:uncharacterized RDD family membrane protein YckC